MSQNTIVTLSEGGTKEHTEYIGQITVPALWHIAEALRKDGIVADGPGCAEVILKCWDLCHDLKNHITNQPD